MKMNKRTNAGKRVSIGKQDFASLIENNFYYGDVMKEESLKQISRRQPKNKGHSKQTT